MTESKDLARRVEKLESELKHWKSNHAAEVQRARVLKERTDMPLERVHAYEQIGQLAAELQKAKGNRDIWAAEHERQIEEKRALAAELKALREQEPVAGQCRFDGESEWKSCTVVHHLHVHANPKEWPHYETRALYALPVPAESAIETPAKVSPCAGHAVQQEADEAGGA